MHPHIPLRSMNDPSRNCSQTLRRNIRNDFKWIVFKFIKNLQRGMRLSQLQKDLHRRHSWQHKRSQNLFHLTIVPSMERKKNAAMSTRCRIIWQEKIHLACQKNTCIERFSRAQHGGYVIGSLPSLVMANGLWQTSYGKPQRIDCSTADLKNNAPAGSLHHPPVPNS